jgi:hypothetical protein
MKKYDDIEAWFHCEDEGPIVGIRFQQMFTGSQGSTSSVPLPRLHTSFVVGLAGSQRPALGVRLFRVHLPRRASG